MTSLISTLFFLMASFSPPSHIDNPTTPTLKPCPDSPNCVCTQESRSSKKMVSLKFSDSLENPIEQLEKVINSYKRTTLVEKTDDYLHYEFKTALGGFIDDVEFVVDRQSKEIHFRSASRVGYSDLGKNRRRMKGIQKKWKKILKNPF